MKNAAAEFNYFYKKKYESRNIFWAYDHGNTEVQTNFTAKPIRLILNVFQAAIVDQFNDVDHLTVQQLREAT